MIKQHGGIFGRNPTFNNVTVEGDLSLQGHLIINGEVITGLDFEGSWNADTNTPAIVSGTGVVGQFYIVSVAGTTTIDGISNWGVGDWIIFDGVSWQRIEGGADGNFVNLNVSGLSVLGETQADSYELSSAGIITEASTSRTLSAGDNGKVIYCTSGSAVTITTAAGLNVGFSCVVVQGGAGNVTFVQGAGTTLGSYSGVLVIEGIYGVAKIIVPVADVFVLSGNLGSTLLSE
jgi:hypothetical protein